MEKTLPGSQLVYVSETRGLSSVFGDRLVLYRYSGKLLSAFLKPKCYQISYKTSLSHVLSVFDKAAETVGKFMQGWAKSMCWFIVPKGNGWASNLLVAIACTPLFCKVIEITIMGLGGEHPQNQQWKSFRKWIAFCWNQDTELVSWISSTKDPAAVAWGRGRFSFGDNRCEDKLATCWMLMNRVLAKNDK